MFTGRPLNSCPVNLYKDEKDYVVYHADDKPIIGIGQSLLHDRLQNEKLTSLFSSNIGIRKLLNPMRKNNINWKTAAARKAVKMRSL